jgi:hypothetical protein
MPRERFWTEDEESVLRENYPMVSFKALSGMLGRSVSSVEGKARRMGQLRNNRISPLTTLNNPNSQRRRLHPFPPMHTLSKRGEELSIKKRSRR